MIEIVPALEADVAPIASAMRPIDRQEAEAFGHSPEDALILGMKAGEAWTVLVDGTPHAMFGVVVTSALDGEGRPWMLGTDEVYRQGRAMLTLGKHRVQRLFDSTQRLSNLVSSANTRAIRLLERWGFVVEREETMIGDVPFRIFWQERR
jgi:ribosomal protein S18 acetylase RimI-like enzyme